MIQGGDPVSESQVSPGIEGMPVSVMGGNPVQQGDGVMITVSQDVVFSGFKLRIRVAAGAVLSPLLLVLLAAEESGEGIKAKPEIPEGILLLVSSVITLVIAVLAVAALRAAPCAAEGIVITGRTGSAGRAIGILIRIAAGLFDLPR